MAFNFKVYILFFSSLTVILGIPLRSNFTENNGTNDVTAEPDLSNTEVAEIQPLNNEIEPNVKENEIKPLGQNDNETKKQEIIEITTSTPETTTERVTTKQNEVTQEKHLNAIINEISRDVIKQNEIVERTVEPVILTTQAPTTSTTTQKLITLRPGPKSLLPTLKPFSELNEVERAERINKGFERMIQFVNIMGQVDTFLSDRTRSMMRRLALLSEPEEDLYRNRRSRYRRQHY